MVGAVRFELTTSCTRNKRASQATLRPDAAKKLPVVTPDCNHDFVARHSLALPPERWWSPPAAPRSVEVAGGIPEPFHQLCCWGPSLRRAEVAPATQAGRSAVWRWGVHAPNLPRGTLNFDLGGAHVSVHPHD